MERDNHTILVIVGLVTLGVFTYLFHQAEMKELRSAVRHIEYSNQEMICEVRGDCVEESIDDIFDF